MSVASPEVVDIPKLDINVASEDIVDEGGAPVSRGDEGILEGVAIGDNFDEGNSSGSDEDETGIVIHAGRATARRPIYKSFGLKSQRNQSLLKDTAGAAQKTGEDDELKKLRFIRHVTAFDVDINTLDEHPWRNNNVDLLDYFNYGFGENTWMEYCERQLRIRAGKGLGPHQPVMKLVVPVVQPVVPPAVVVKQEATPTTAVTKAPVLSTPTQSTDAQIQNISTTISQLPHPAVGVTAFQHMAPPLQFNPASAAGFPPSLTEAGWQQAGGRHPLPVPHHHMHMPGAPHLFPGQLPDMWGREFQQPGNFVFDGAHQQNFQHQFHQQPINPYGGGVPDRQYPPPASVRSEPDRSVRPTSSRRESSPPRSSQSRRDREDSGRSERDRGSDDHKTGESSSKRSREPVSESRAGDRDRDRERDRVPAVDHNNSSSSSSSSRRDEVRDRDSSRSQRDRPDVASGSSSKRRQTDSRSRSRSRDRKQSRGGRDNTDDRRRK